MDIRKDIDSDCKEMFEDEPSIEDPNIIDYDRQRAKKETNTRKKIELAKKSRMLR